MKRRKKRTDGRFFFVTLLCLSALVILSIYLFKEQTQDKQAGDMISFYDKFAMNEVFITQLSKAYPLEQAQQIQEEVSDFYKAAWEDHTHKTRLYEVSTQIEGMMADHRILDTEIQSLLALIRLREER